MGTNGVNNNVYSSFYNDIGNNVLFSVRAKNRQNQQQKTNLTSKNTPIASINLNTTSETTSPKSNLLQWGIGIASAATILAIGSIFLTRGGSAKTFERMNRWISKLDDKVYNLGETNKTVNFIRKANIACVNGIKKVLSYVKISANFTAIKDTFFRKITDTTFTIGSKQYRPLKFIADGCAKLSESITMASAKRLGSKAISQADDLSAYCAKYSKDILSKGADDVIEIGKKQVKVAEFLKTKFQYNGKEYTGKDLLGLMQDTAKGFKGQVDDVFCATSRMNRTDAVKAGLEGLETKVEQAISLKNPQWKKNLTNGYVTENLSAPSRAQSSKLLMDKTRQLTNGIEDMSLTMSKNLDEIRGQIPSSDKATLDTARKLSKKIQKYRTLSGQEERLRRSDLNQEIVDLTRQLDTAIKGSKIAPELQADMLKHTRNITDVIEHGGQKGTLQELQTMLRVMHNGEGNIYASQKSRIMDCEKAIRKAADFEREAYKRQAELKVGAAFTDYAFLAAAAGLGVHQVVKQDNKDAMISASLTRGIPVFGTLGLCLYQTAKGMTGVGPLAIALIGGKILNMIGTAVSDKYLASANSKKQFLQELVALKGAQQKTNVG